MTEVTEQGKRGGLGKLLVVPFALAGGWIAYSQLAVNHRVPLPDAILAERRAFLSQQAGWLSYYEDRSTPGRPLVLVHSVNAAASAYEMGPLFRYYRGQRPVFALDLPGYGFSNRLPRNYTAQLFADAILDFLESQVGESADVVALSLGSEFVARAALNEPERFRSLALISPSGFNRFGEGRPTQQASMRQGADRLHRLFSVPLWARALFDLLTTRPVLRFYLRQSFVGQITPGFIDYGYATAHQPGAEHVPLHFISGRLFTPNAAATLYDKVTTPTLVLYDQDFYVTFEELPVLLARNAAWQAVRIAPTRGLPHFEKLEETAEALDAFWASL